MDRDVPIARLPLGPLARLALGGFLAANGARVAFDRNLADAALLPDVVAPELAHRFDSRAGQRRQD